MKKLNLYLILSLLLVNFSLQAQTEITVEIGAGGTTGTSNNLPFTSNASYSYTQQIYTVEEIRTANPTAVGGMMITQIRVYKSNSNGSFGAAAYGTGNITVRLGNTTQNVFSGNSDWIPFGDLTQVAYINGVLNNTNWSIYEGYRTITLSTPFEYLSGYNLVFSCQEGISGYGSSTVQPYHTYETGSSRAISYNGNSTLNVNSPANGTLLTSNNMIEFIGTPIEGEYNTFYTIETNCGLNGTITPSGKISVPEGQDTTFTITSNQGYEISEVLIDYKKIELTELVNNTYTFYDVRKDHYISATFKASANPVYTINASAGDHGSITPSGAITVTEGSNRTFTITPDTDYEIDTVKVDGTPVMVSNNTYTFENVTANHTISAIFKKPISGVDEWRVENGEWRIYPNPTTGQLTISDMRLSDVRLYDVMGREISVGNRKSEIGKSKIQLDLSHLPAGIYFLKTSGKMAKVIKN